MEKESYTQGEDIITQGDDGVKMYFLHSGKVEVLTGDEPGPVAELEAGGVFGELALFNMRQRNVTIRAADFCDCRVLYQRDFRRIVQKFPEERHFFETAGEERRIKRDNSHWMSLRDQTKSPLSVGILDARRGLEEEERRASLTANEEESTDQEGLSAGQILQASAFFSGRDPEFLHRLSIGLVPETFEVGAAIIQEGEEGYQFYLLAAGLVEVVVGPDETQVAVLEPGSVFGEMMLFGMAKRTATIRAMTVCSCYVGVLGVFHVLLQKFPSERRYFTAMAKQRRQQLDRLRSHSKETVYRRPPVERVDRALPPALGAAPADAAPSADGSPVGASSNAGRVFSWTAASNQGPVPLHLSNFGQGLIKASTPRPARLEPLEDMAGVVSVSAPASPCSTRNGSGSVEQGAATTSEQAEMWPRKPRSDPCSSRGGDSPPAHPLREVLRADLFEAQRRARPSGGTAPASPPERGKAWSPRPRPHRRGASGSRKVSFIDKETPGSRLTARGLLRFLGADADGRGAQCALHHTPKTALKLRPLNVEPFSGQVRMATVRAAAMAATCILPPTEPSLEFPLASARKMSSSGER